MPLPLPWLGYFWWQLLGVQAESVLLSACIPLTSSWQAGVVGKGRPLGLQSDFRGGESGGLPHGDSACICRLQEPADLCLQEASEQPPLAAVSWGLFIYPTMHVFLIWKGTKLHGQLQKAHTG